MVINIHAGHNPDGKVACGAVGMLLESTEARRVKDRVCTLLKANACTVYDCTVEDGISQSDVLQKIVRKCNANEVELDVSIHFNSGRNDYAGDDSLGGVEIYTYAATSKAVPAAKSVIEKIAAKGYRNRGTKVADFYVLRKSKAPAMLIECCFVDDADDVDLYDADSIAQAIAEGILATNHSAASDSSQPEQEPVSITTPTSSSAAAKPSPPYYVKIKALTLNIRASSSINSKIKGVVRNKEIYTIVETKGHWGRLKSGAGWISISTKYVQYI